MFNVVYPTHFANQLHTGTSTYKPLLCTSHPLFPPIRNKLPKMQEGTPLRSFRPISFEQLDNDDKGKPQVKTTLFKPIARTVDSLPIFFDGHRSGNTLPNIPADPPPWPEHPDLLSTPEHSPAQPISMEVATPPQLTISYTPNDDTILLARASQIRPPHSRTSSSSSPDQVLIGPVVRAPSVSFQEDVQMHTLQSPITSGCQPTSKTHSLFSEGTVLTSSLGQCPTITSIQTTNSNLSSHCSDLLKPIPRKANDSFDAPDFGPVEEVTAEEPKQTAAHNSLPVLKDRTLDSDPISNQGRRSAPFLSRIRSDNAANFRRIVSSRRDKATTGSTSGEKQSTSSSSSSLPKEGNDARSVTKKFSSGQDSGTGNRLSMKLFEKKSSSQSHDDEENPWFHASASHADDANSVDVEEDISQLKAAKSKKKRMKKLTMKLRGKDGRERESHKSSKFSVSAGSNGSVPAVGDDEFSVNANEEEIPIMSCHDLEQDLKQVLSGKPKLEQVLDTVMRLPDRPGEEVAVVLYKFLATTSAIEKGMGLILLDDKWNDDKVPWLNFQTKSATYVPYRELLVHIYVNGPRRIKKAIVNHSKIRLQMLSFLGGEKQRSEDRDSRLHAYKVNCVAKIFNSLLESHRDELTECIAARKGCLQAIVRNNIHIPEVVDFVSQLCAANALSDTSNDGNRYGAPNAAGIVLLEKEGICNMLVRSFADSSNPKEYVGSEKPLWQSQVMAMRCLLELSKRSVSIPPFSKTNCSYSSRFMKSVNGALLAINSFDNHLRVGLLLEAGLGAVRECKGNSSDEVVALSNNAAVCALSFVADLLEMVRDAVNSKSVVTQRTIGRVHVGGLEALILSHWGQLGKLLQSSDKKVVKGRLKVAIVKTLCCLLSSRVSETRSEVLKNGFPQILLEAVSKNKLCSTLHRYVVDCIKVSMGGDCSTGLHKAWFSAMQGEGGIMNELEEFVKSENEERRSEEWESYKSTVVEIGFIASEQSQNLTRAEFRGMFTSEQRYKTFTLEIETGLRKVEEGRKGACGGPKPVENVVSVLANAESLAARLDDVNAV